MSDTETNQSVYPLYALTTKDGIASYEVMPGIFAMILFKTVEDALMVGKQVKVGLEEEISMGAYWLVDAEKKKVTSPHPDPTPDSASQPETSSESGEMRQC